jgi:hypothetical protein
MFLQVQMHTKGWQNLKVTENVWNHESRPGWGLAETILECTEKCLTNLILWGEGYDDASAMSGKLNGVQVYAT